MTVTSVYPHTHFDIDNHFIPQVFPEYVPEPLQENPSLWMGSKDAGRQVALKECAEKERVDFEQNLNLKEVRQQPSQMISCGDCQVCITRPFGCPLLTCTSSPLPLGPHFPEKSGKKGP